MEHDKNASTIKRCFQLALRKTLLGSKLSPSRGAVAEHPGPVAAVAISTLATWKFKKTFHNCASMFFMS